MKTLVSILAVAVIAIAVTMGFASDAQMLSKAELGNFAGAGTCNCEPASPDAYDPYCKDICLDTGNTSQKYCDPLDEQTRLCNSISSYAYNCLNDHTIKCGTSADTRDYHVWNSNDDCYGAYDDTIESYGVELAMANGTACP